MKNKIIISTYMWYKYINRADYDPVRVFRYHICHLDAATSDSMLTIAA